MPNLKILSSQRAHRFTIIILDILAVTASYIFAFLLRFDFSLNEIQFVWLAQSLPMALAVQIATFAWFDLYRGMWRYSSFSDMINIGKAVGLAGVFSAAGILFLHHANFPRTILINFPVLAFVTTAGVRFAVRWIKTYLSHPEGQGPFKNVIVVGAGDSGESILRRIIRTPEARYRVLGLIDKDPKKWGLFLHGHKVLGGLDALTDLMKRKKVDEIVIAVNSQRGDLVSSIMKNMRSVGASIEIKIAPSLDEMLLTPGRRVALRKVKPADLLNRQIVRLDAAIIKREFAQKTVLITGAGGTIGAELARQVLQYSPKKLLILENHATSLFYIGNELRELSKNTEVVSILGDIRDYDLVDRIFNTGRPQIVLHAAAHKHLPQLEQQVNIHEGVKNNIVGTHVLADAAHRYGSQSFLLISTDKAVHPSSVMGMTKRVAEIATRSYTHVSSTRFMSVRFGNVLGSSGSMLKIFQEQIAQRKPISVTHPDATRYFMLVEEAVQLILQAVAISKGGEIFTLNMGTPINILELAKNLVLLSGLDPEKDIPIQIVGLRPGEKLHEELFEEEEGRIPTSQSDIFICRPNGIDFERTAQDLRKLNELLNGETAPMLAKLHEIVSRKHLQDDGAFRAGSILSKVEATESIRAANPETALLH